MEAFAKEYGNGAASSNQSFGLEMDVDVGELVSRAVWFSCVRQNIQ